VEPAALHVTLDPESDLALTIKEAAASGARVVVETGEASYDLEVSPTDPEPRAARLRRLAHRLAGSLALVDIPGWESSEAAERWGEQLRQGDHYPFDPPSQS
jgi:hypothetical protein